MNILVTGGAGYRFSHSNDRTGVMDYIHVVDLAYGHVKAIDYLNSKDTMKPLIVNLGTGKGYSALDMVKAFEKV